MATSIRHSFLMQMKRRLQTASELWSDRCTRRKFYAYLLPGGGGGVPRETGGEGNC